MSKEKTIKNGDMLWVKLKGPVNDYGYGEVIEVFETDKGRCFEFHCLVNGGRRLGLEKDIINKPTARMMSKMVVAQKDIQEVLKKK